MMLHVSLILLSASACLAQVAFPATCPDLETKENFDVTQYLGTWYEAAKYPTQFETDGKCNTATYTANDDGTVRVVNAMISTVDGEAQSINGTATFAGSSDEAKLLVSFSTDPTARKAPYWIIDTDYDNWAVVHGCSDAGESSYRFLWILTRARNPSSGNILQLAYDVIDNNNLSRDPLTVTDQTDC